MIKVITYGTFDLFHVGHLKLLERCKSLGNHLTVCVSSDEFNNKKGKSSIIKYEERAQIVQSIKYVDKVLKETCWDQKINDIVNNDIDIFVIGDDWKGKFDFLKKYCQVVYLDRTPSISSTQIKELLK